MKKSLVILPLCLLALSGCSGTGTSSSGTASLGTITVCASESPHAEILNDVVKPILAEEGYTLEVTILDWTLQNDAVNKGDYDANYFQHRPYLQQYDSGTAIYDEDYTYTKVFPVAAVHFEPLRIYAGKSTAAQFDSIKTTATYCICNDSSNEIRALDLLVSAGVISSYETDSDGNVVESSLPSNITPLDESLLAASLSDYDYGVLPCNTALTGNIQGDDSLPTETDDVKDYRANVLAASVSKYASDTTYKAKIDALTDAILSDAVSEYIVSEYNNVIIAAQSDLR